MKKFFPMLAMMPILWAAEPLPATQRAHLAMGRDLYRENCSVCHDIDRDKRHSHKLGPSLNHLFKNETLPASRGKPNRQYVEVRIKFGGMLMPAFGKRLTPDEIAALVDYIDSK